ncbi:hypothetical protein [Caulobacter sp. DWR2-3-1b2]
MEQTASRNQDDPRARHPTWRSGKGREILLRPGLDDQITDTNLR